MLITSQKTPRLLRPEEIIALSNELQSMIAAGVPVSTGLGTASVGFPPHLEQVCQRLAERLSDGADLADAVAREPAIPPTFRAVLAAGLKCGQGEAVLSECNRATELLYQFQRSTKIGMVYPLIVITVSIFLFIAISTVMFPRIIDLYQDLAISIPGWLRVTQRLPDTLVLSVAAIAFVVTLLILLRNDGRRSVPAGIVWIPGMRRVLADFEIANFSYLLATLLNYRVPFPEAWRLAVQANSQTNAIPDTDAIEKAVEEGQDLDATLLGSQSLPPFLSWILQTGYHSSDLPNALLDASDFYRNRGARKAFRLSRTIPVVAVLGAGGIVTTLYALTVLSPLIQVWEHLGDMVSARVP